MPSSRSRANEETFPETYSSIGVTPLGITHTGVLVRSALNGDVVELPPEDVDLLMACRRFMSLDEHSERCLNRLGLPVLRGRAGTARREDIGQGLQRLVRRKLLCSRSSLVRLWLDGKPLEEPHTPRPRITHLGIPTKGRPGALTRALESYSRNARLHGRDVLYFIADDERNEKASSENRLAVERGSAHIRSSVKVADRTFRARFAIELARFAGVPPALSEFALLGDPAHQLSYGAARNTLLLLTAGHVSMQVDDDTACTLAERSSTQPGLSVTSSLPKEFWYFDSRASAEKILQPSDVDFLGLHEQLLGVGAARRIRDTLRCGEEIGFDSISDETCIRARNEDSRIVLTQIGWYGDSAQGSSAYRLLLDGASFDRLTRDKRSYRTALNAREVINTVPRHAITDGGTLMAMNLGLYGCDLLPPFMPAGRNEDAVFGALLKTCFKSYFRGYLAGPCMLHDPPEKRPRPSLRFHPFRGNALLAILIPSLVEEIDADPVAALNAAGAGLIHVCAVTDRAFEDFVARTCEAALCARINFAEQLLLSRPESPTFWKRGVEKHLIDIKRAIFEGRTSFTAASKQDRDLEVQATRRMFRLFGQLLQEWPALYEAAKEFDPWGEQPA